VNAVEFQGTLRCAMVPPRPSTSPFKIEKARAEVASVHAKKKRASNLTMILLAFSSDRSETVEFTLLN
jgi:hypothetical protein